jgi:hypothetical protein
MCFKRTRQTDSKQIFMNYLVETGWEENESLLKNNINCRYPYNYQVCKFITDQKFHDNYRAEFNLRSQYISFTYI